MHVRLRLLRLSGASRNLRVSVHKCRAIACLLVVLCAYCVLTYCRVRHSEVEIDYLPVGHTHELIDQVFSRFAIALATKECFTIDDFHKILSDSYTIIKNAVVPKAKVRACL